MFLRLLTNAEFALRGLPRSLAGGDSRLQHLCELSSTSLRSVPRGAGEVRDLHYDGHGLHIRTFLSSIDLRGVRPGSLDQSC